MLVVSNIQYMWKGLCGQLFWQFRTSSGPKEEFQMEVNFGELRGLGESRRGSLRSFSGYKLSTLAAHGTAQSLSPA